MLYNDELFECEEDFKEAFSAASMKTKDDVIRSLKHNLKTDRWDYGGNLEHSEGFLTTRKELAERFLQRILETNLFDAPDDYWVYSYEMSSTGMELLLEHCIGCRCEENGCVIPDTFDESFVMVSVKSKLLPADEYAARYGIESATVRQWIRRGKIRTAVKLGSGWCVPELTEIPGRGYHMGQFRIDEELIDCPKEFSFLREAVLVTLEQMKSDKSKYFIFCENEEGEIREMVCDAPEREKIERFLIESPQCRYLDCLGSYSD